MTPKTKLEIIGPYTPEHEGPFCTRDCKSARILCTNRKGMSPIVALVQDGDKELLVAADMDGVAVTLSRNYNIMNAREVPVAREFWVNEYSWGLGDINETPDRAKRRASHEQYIRTIHVREVLPGDGE